MSLEDNMITDIMNTWIQKLRTAETEEQKNAIINVLRTLLHIKVRLHTPITDGFLGVKLVQ